MNETLINQYSRIKREFEIFKEMKEKLGLSRSNYVNLKDIKKKLQQSNIMQNHESK